MSLTSGNRVETRGLQQITDSGSLEGWIDTVFGGLGEQVTAYRDGKESPLGFFVDRGMALSRGRADPKQVSELLRTKLNGSSLQPTQEPHLLRKEQDTPVVDGGQHKDRVLEAVTNSEAVGWACCKCCCLVVAPPLESGSCP